MADDPPSPHPSLGNFQGYLLLLARTQLEESPRLRIDPQDAVQQTLAIAQEKLHQFRGKNNRELAGWLRTILANHLTDLLRRNGREFDEQTLARQLEQSSARLDELLAADQSSPSQRITEAERLLHLADALRELPEDQRRAVELRHLKGLTLAEISESLGKTMPAVGGLLQRGLKTLREKMGQGVE